MSARTFPELFQEISRSRGDAPFLLHKENGSWRETTWRLADERHRQIARSLLALGVEPQSRVAILSETRLEWILCDLAAMGCGAVTVGIYPSSPANDCAYVLDHSDAVLVFVENAAQLRKLAPVRRALPRLRHVVVLDGPGADGAMAWSDFLAAGHAVSDADLAARAAAVRPDDLASLVYTSGTTGVPKGVMLTHAGILFAAESAAQALDIGAGRTFLLFLPLAHVFARLTVHLCLATGNVVAVAESIQRVADNLREVRPHFLAGVPRMFEKIHDRIDGEVRRAGGLRQAIFVRALAAGDAASRLERQGRRVPLHLRARRALAHALVFRKIHAALGGRIVFMISGAAPLDPRIAEFFHACGVLILEGIGMTENSSFSHLNRRDRFRFGTVGLPGPGIEVRMADDGEILIRGPNVMRGYFKDPEATQAALDADGWLHTGDVGDLDSDGFLRVTDRKKDLIVTSGGKNVAPQRVERALTASPYITQAIVFGDGRKYLTALVLADADELRSWAASRGKAETDLAALAADPDVQALLESEVATANRQLASFETVKKVRLLPVELSVERGELTPTLKVRRKAVAATYRDLIEAMYRD